MLPLKEGKPLHNWERGQKPKVEGGADAVSLPHSEAGKDLGDQIPTGIRPRHSGYRNLTHEGSTHCSLSFLICKVGIIRGLTPRIAVMIKKKKRKETLEHLEN